MFQSEKTTNLFKLGHQKHKSDIQKIQNALYITDQNKEKNTNKSIRDNPEKKLDDSIEKDPFQKEGFNNSDQLHNYLKTIQNTDANNKKQQSIQKSSNSDQILKQKFSLKDNSLKQQHENHRKREDQNLMQYKISSQSGDKTSTVNSNKNKTEVQQKNNQTQNGNGLVLFYWPIRGLAERIRLLLHYLNLEYKDQYFQNQNEWNEASKKIKYPIINLPYLKDNDTIVVETTAIITYLILKANREQLLGRNSQQKVKIAEIQGFFGKLYSQYILVVYGEFNDKKQSFLSNIQDSFKNLSQFMGSNDYICGDITYIDFLFAQFFNIIDQMDPKLMDKFPKLKDLNLRIWKQPGIGQYVQNEKFLNRPLNSQHAKWNGK